MNLINISVLSLAGSSYRSGLSVFVPHTTQAHQHHNTYSWLVFIAPACKGPWPGQMSIDVAQGVDTTKQHAASTLSPSDPLLSCSSISFKKFRSKILCFDRLNTGPTTSPNESLQNISQIREILCSLTFISAPKLASNFTEVWRLCTLQILLTRNVMLIFMFSYVPTLPLDHVFLCDACNQCSSHICDEHTVRGTLVRLAAVVELPVHQQRLKHV